MADEIVTPETEKPAAAPAPTSTAVAAEKGDFAAFTAARDRAQRGEEPAPVEEKPVAAAAEPSAEAEEPVVEGEEKPSADHAASEAGAKLAKRKGSLQDRINELTHDKYATVRERDAARAEATRLQHELNALRAAAPVKPVPDVDPAALPKPKVEDFQTYEDFVEALSDWKAEIKAAKHAAAVEKKIDDRLASERNAAQTDAATRAQQELFNQHRVRVDAFEKTHPDLKAVMAEYDSDEFMVPSLMQEHILRSDLGPALLYHLAKHPDDFRRITALPQGPMLVALGKLEARLDVATSGPTPAAAPVTRAPAPIKPVGSSATATTVSTRDLAEQGRGREFIDRRDREERERNQRRA